MAVTSTNLFSNATTDQLASVGIGDLIIVSYITTNGTTPIPTGYTKIYSYVTGNNSVSMYWKYATTPSELIKVPSGANANVMRYVNGKIDKTETSSTTLNTSIALTAPSFIFAQANMVNYKNISNYPLLNFFSTYWSSNSFSLKVLSTGTILTPVNTNNNGEVRVTIVEKQSNNLPTQPGTFIKQPAANSINLSSEIITIQWPVSTDADGDTIKYNLEFYNGLSWNTLAFNLTSLTYTHTLPSISITTAQYRVKAVDSKGGESAYRTSNVFTIRKHLLLFQDGRTLKTYKNGSWQII